MQGNSMKGISPLIFSQRINNVNLSELKMEEAIDDSSIFSELFKTYFNSC